MSIFFEYAYYGDLFEIYTKNKNISMTPSINIFRIIINTLYIVYKKYKISHRDIKGWLSKEYIWGVYENEVYNKRFYQPIITQYWKILDSNFVTKTLDFN